MFETTLLESSPGQSPSLTRRHRIFTTLGATALEFGALGALVLAPLVRTQALDLKALVKDRIYLPAPPPSVQIVAVVHEKSVRPIVDPAREGPIIAPKNIPPLIAQIVDEPAPPVGSDVNVIGGDPNGPRIPGGDAFDWLRTTTRVNPPPPPAEHKTKPADRIVKGGDVQAAKLIYAPRPEYPAHVKLIRVQGTVRLEAIIGRDGSIQNLRAMSGPPLLFKAALDAVSQWRYQPTLLNGEAVEVQTEIMVNFILGD